MVDNGHVTTPDRNDEQDQAKRVSQPDGGLNDGAAAMAMMALAIGLIVLVIILL